MRSNQLLGIRPALNLSSSEDQSDAESFQNQTLRPILKFQHELTLRMILLDKNFSKQIKQFKSTEQLHSGINNYVNNNKTFRSQLIGAIIGLMTMEEYDIYAKNSSEYNRRITTMQIQRYVDSITLN